MDQQKGFSVVETRVTLRTLSHMSARTIPLVKMLIYHQAKMNL